MSFKDAYRRLYERMEFNIYLLPEKQREAGWKILSKVKHPDEFDDNRKKTK